MTPPTDLVDAARRAQANAYCPYSQYRVGVALRTPSGSIHVGCNVENAAFPAGTCAEAGAIAAMVAAGEREIAEVVVVTGGDHPGSPCGGCRQRLSEFATPDVVIYATTSDGGESIEHSLGDLLPFSFGAVDLE